MMPHTFPEIKGTNLNRKKFHLPRDFEGKLNIVFVAFQREQQLAVNTWLPTADILENIHRDIRYYELPTISRMNPFTRWFINTGMRSGIKDPKSRSKTITLYLDKDSFRQDLGIPGEDDIHILLLDKQGNVAWRSQGPCDAEKAKLLSDAVKNLLQM